MKLRQPTGDETIIIIAVLALIAALTYNAF